MKTIDCITYNGEKELFEMRYNILKDYIDQFIVVEFDKTFSGKPKQQLFTQHWDKVKYFWHDESIYNAYTDLALSSPNTKGASHWKTEFCHKESIKDALTHLDKDDLVFIGDCDEIWDTEALSIDPHQKLRLKVYTYFLNNRSSEIFWGTLFTKYGNTKGCLNHIRTNAPATLKEYGWHFTSMGGHKRVKEKLSDSYTRESYWTKQVESDLGGNIDNNRDFLGRDFKFEVDESDWPSYLKNNRQNYKHLLK